MSIGDLASDPRVTFYREPRTWSATALRALAARTGEAQGAAAWQGQEIDAFAADDRSQWWEQRWLSSYRTVLIQRSQTLQRTLNAIYSRQLAGALFRPVAGDPNYNMANLQRMGRDPTGQTLGPTEGVRGSDASLFSMDYAFVGGTKARKDQDPVSFAWGIPPRPEGLAGFVGGPDWGALAQDDFGAWISRQYRNPDMPFEFPNPLEYLHWHSAEDLLAPSTGRLELGLGYFDVAGFVSALFAPLLYPIFFQRLETFAHSEAGGNAIDAAAIRSSYQFKLKGLSDFPLLGPAMGSVIGLMATIIGAAPIPTIDPTDPTRLITFSPPAGPDATAQSLDLLLRAQPWVSAPRKTETEPGAFFATTLALQDWGLQELEYSYFSAARYQQEVIDTDMLTAFRKAGSKAIKLVINAALIAAPPIKLLTMIPGVSTIFDAILNFATDNLTNMVLRPIRDLIELDPQYMKYQQPQVEADNSAVYHIGDPPGLFGLTAPWEPAGFASGYGLADDPTNYTEINQVEIIAKRHTLTDLWDGQGIADQQYSLERRRYEGISSRLVNAGLQANEALDLTEFRTQVHEGVTTGAGLGSYSRKRDDYSLAAKSLLGNRIDVGTDVLNPGFGGGILMTDIDTTRLDTFFHGSIAWAPRFGEFTYVYDPGTLPADAPDAPVFDPDSGLQGVNAGTVTFAPGPDGISRYTFATLPANAHGERGLQVTYRGRDTLLLDGTTPQHVQDARDPDYYRVTDLMGQPITASVITSLAPAKVTAKLPADWAGPADPLLTVAVNAGVVDLDLGSRVEAAPREIITSRRDTDGGHVNATRLTFLPPDAVTRLRQSPALFGNEDAPASGGDFQIVGNPATDFGNMAAPGNDWVDWKFVAKAVGDDYNRDGAIQAGSLSWTGDLSVVEAPHASKEAVHNWGDLVHQFVPEAFRMAQPLLTGNDSTGRPYAAEAWNTAYRPDGHVLRTNEDGSPYFVSNTPMGYSASSPPPATAVNPYFWSGSDGYQYITIWDGARKVIPDPQTDAERQQNGLPDPTGTPPATIRAVLRMQNGSNKVEVLSDGSAVLLHRETQMAEVPAEAAEAMFADLLARGYTQGRSETDTTVPSLYSRTQNPQPAPPLGTPGDFTVVANGAGGALQIAFTKPYDGMVTVPPNRDGAGNPVNAWWTVNGWYLAGYDDTHPAQAWSGSPAGKLQTSPSGSGLIWAADIPGGQDGTGGKQVTDRLTVAKTVTVAAPSGAPATNTGQILPGESVVINLAGANLGMPASRDFQKLPQVRVASTTGATIDHAVTFEPDRYVVTVTNSRGTVTVPSLKKDTATGEWRPETATDASGLSQVVIPADLLTQGDNTIQVEVRRGGIYQRFCRSEPPDDETSTTSQLAAGFWVNTTTVTDRDGNDWPPGNLFFENRMVGDGTGRYTGLAGTDVIHYNTNMFGPGNAGMDSWVPVDVHHLSWKPDSYDPARSFDGQLIPLIFGTSGGYQRKADIKAGLKISTSPTQQTLHTYGLETVDRYRYDPATQRILDVLPPVTQAQSTGPLWQGGPVGHQTIPAMMPPSDGHRNERFDSGSYIPDALVTSGQNPVAMAAVGSKVDRTNRQVFGSDDNQLVRYLYAAMKIVDVDGQMGAQEGQSRLYREYRDAFNMGYLDHLTIVGSASSPTGGSISSTVEVKWRPDGDGRVDNSYRQNYEYYANEADRERRLYTTKRQAELQMASYHAYRKG